MTHVADYQRAVVDGVQDRLPCFDHSGMRLHVVDLLRLIRVRYQVISNVIGKCREVTREVRIVGDEENAMTPVARGQTLIVGEQFLHYGLRFCC